MDNDTCWLIPFLVKTSRWAGMYFGDLRVRSAYNFIVGYTWARKDLGAPPFGKGEEDVLSDFAKSMEPRTKIVHGEWVDHIECLDHSDRSVITFYRHMMEFLESAGYEPDLWDDIELSPPSIRGFRFEPEE